MAAAVTAFAMTWTIGGTTAMAQEPAPAAEPPAATESLPSAREIIDRFVEAIGGEDAIRKPTQRIVTGRMEMPAQGISADLEFRQMAPDKFAVRADIPGMGAVLSGYDGEVGWTISAMTGPMLLEGKMLSQTERQADFYAALHDPSRYRSMETVARTEFEGAPCYKVKLVTTDGDEIVEYYDVDTGLMAGTEITQETPTGPMPVTATTGEYREFHGIKVATRSVQRMGPGMEQVVILTDVRSTGVQESDFDLPDEIRALIEGEAEPPPPPSNADVK